MSKWPQDNQAALLAFYGTPGPQVEAQLVPVVPPFRMYYEGRLVGSIKFHKKCAGALAAALNEIWEHYGRDQNRIDALGISKYAGAYNPRYIRGSTTKWSNHAYGAAIDLNAEDNGFGKGHGNIPQPVIDAFKRQGARWGGDYRGRTDPMHFEFCDPGYVKPVGLMDDGGSDAESDTGQDGGEVEITTEKNPSWLKRKWKTLTGWLSGGAATGVLGYLTSPWAIVAVFGCVVVVAILFILFMGPGDVRAWIKRQVN